MFAIVDNIGNISSNSFIKFNHILQLIQVISSEAPLGRALLGKCEGDEVSILGAPIQQQFEVLRVH